MSHFLKLFLVAVLALGAPFSSLSAKQEPLTATPQVRHVSVVVIGGGMGALTSSLYLARAGVVPLVLVGKTPGGLLTQSHAVQNWPGELEIDGSSLTEKVRAQAEFNGALFSNEEVVRVDFSKRPFTLETHLLDGSGGSSRIEADAVIIAMGTEPNFLHIPGESGPNGYWGRGITNCAVCDGSLYRDQVVGVVGGGDAAVLEALYLSNIAKEVHVFVRKGHFKGIEEKRLQALLMKPNVKILFHTTVEEVKGDGSKVTGVVLKREKEGLKEMALDGLFLAIGSTPNTALFKGKLKLDERGYILLTQDQKTSIDGVYAVGDIVDPLYKQAISAAGDGAKAALQVQTYLGDRSQRGGSKLGAENAKQARREVIEVTSRSQFEKELKGSDVPVVVDFYASWCGPCKRLSPLLESSASHLSGKVKFLKVNVDQCNDLSQFYGVRSMPTVLLFDPSGQVVDRKVGTDQISDFLQTLSD